MSEWWSLDWAELDARFAWIRAMRDCEQDPIYHAEGNVWIHTRMVCDELKKLDYSPKRVLFAAALLHDVAKPVCSRVENGRITSRGHSARGALMARRILWELGWSFEEREQVCGLIRFHQLPYWLLERPDARKAAYTASMSARCDWLSKLAEADVRGRICQDQDKLIVNVELFAELCREEACWSGPRQFASRQSRFEYFRTEGRDPSYAAFDTTQFEVVLLSGLPGSGKDTLVRSEFQSWPCISLDEIRKQLGVSWTDDQAPVVHLARERARELLRSQSQFVWNATNLTRDLRRQLIDLFAGYGARVRIVYVDCQHGELLRRNRSRGARVPEHALDRMIEKWDVPDATEAHTVEWRAAV